MLYSQFSLFLALSYGASSLSISNQRRDALQAGQLPLSFFTQPLNLEFVDDYGGTYAIELNTSTLCGDEVVANYDSSTGAGDASVTLSTMLQDIDNHNSDTEWVRNLALSALEDSLEAAITQWYRCHGNPIWHAVGESFVGTSRILPIPAPVVPLTAVNQGDYIKAANKGAITANLIKGVGIGVTVGLGVTSTLLSDPNAKMKTGAVAGSVSVVLLFILGALVDWVKNQGSLDGSDAAMLKLFAEWARLALGKTGQTVNSCDDPKKSLEFAQRYISADNYLYRHYGMVSEEQLESLGERSKSCGV